jgi:hypothetical protein
MAARLIQPFLPDLRGRALGQAGQELVAIETGLGELLLDRPGPDRDLLPRQTPRLELGPFRLDALLSLDPARFQIPKPLVRRLEPRPRRAELALHHETHAQALVEGRLLLREGRLTGAQPGLKLLAAAGQLVELRIHPFQARAQGALRRAQRLDPQRQVVAGVAGPQGLAAQVVHPAAQLVALGEQPVATGGVAVHRAERVVQAFARAGEGSLSLGDLRQGLLDLALGGLGPVADLLGAGAAAAQLRARLGQEPVRSVRRLLEAVAVLLRLRDCGAHPLQAPLVGRHVLLEATDLLGERLDLALARENPRVGLVAARHAQPVRPQPDAIGSHQRLVLGQLGPAPQGLVEVRGAADPAEQRAQRPGTTHPMEQRVGRQPRGGGRPGRGGVEQRDGARAEPAEARGRAVEIGDAGGLEVQVQHRLDGTLPLRIGVQPLSQARGVADAGLPEPLRGRPAVLAERRLL